MYRSGTHEGQYYNLLFNQGGVGDLIGQLPCIKYILDHHRHNFYHIWVHSFAYELCVKLFSGYKNCSINSLANSENYNNTLPYRTPYGHRITNLACHITDHAFLTLLGTDVENKYKNYLQLDPIDVSSFSLPEKYVVVTTGYTSEVRKWLLEYVNEVSDYIVSKGYAPVYLGKSYTPAYQDLGIEAKLDADYSKGINLIDKTNLFEAHSIMAGAQVVLGLDNGLLHLACMSNVDTIWGFTTVKPAHRLPYRDDYLGFGCLTVTPDPKTLACTFCQSNLSFETSHNFINCFYKDKACLSELNTIKWINKLELFLCD